MTPEDEPAPLEASKTLKVSVPMAQHMRLQARRILQDRTLSETVIEALEAYFEAHGIDDGVLLGEASRLAEEEP